MESAQRSRSSLALRAYAVVALPITGLALAWWLSAHAFGPATMMVPLIAYCVVVLLRPDWWLLLLPALWPIADLARWTGQIHVTETDALLLATVASLSLRTLMERTRTKPQEMPVFRPGLAAWLAMTLIAVATIVAIVRGMSEFPPISFGAWTGYSGSMNAVRVGKGFLLPLLLLPFLQAALRQDGAGTFRRVSLGLALGLGSASLAALWERAAFPGLSDFAQDYRTTALFWEMHVGGAALDGWLALTLPFALYAAWAHRHSRRWMPLCLGILALGGYAILTTFSRGLYLAVAIAFSVMGYTLVFERNRPDQRWHSDGIVAVAATTIAAFAVAILAFRHGGYRGAGAMLLTAGLAYGLVGQVSGMRIAQVIASIGVGVVLYAAGSWAGQILSKGPYIVFAVAWMASVVIASRLGCPNARDGLRGMGLALFWWTLAASIEVVMHWGGGEGLVEASVAGFLIAVPALAQMQSKRRLWKPSAPGILASSVVAVASLLSAAVFGSYYFHARASTAGVDLEGRLSHWQHSATLARTDDDRWLGIGAGRFSETYFWNVPQGLFPGTWRISRDDGNTFLELGPPRHMWGFGEMFRVTQAAPLDVHGPFLYRFRARAASDTQVRFEVCRKHLLYTDDCVIRGVKVKGGQGWQSFAGVTEAGSLNRGPWYAPRLASVSLDLEGGALADVDDMEIVDTTGQTIVQNGDFERGPVFWFFSSDKHHLPWHAKNMALHTYVEGGILGLAALVTVCALALMRAARGVRSHGPIGGVLLGSILALLTVGLFDSLIDVPRLSMWFLIVLWISLSLHRGRQRGNRAPAQAIPRMSENLTVTR